MMPTPVAIALCSLAAGCIAAFAAAVTLASCRLVDAVVGD